MPNLKKFHDGAEISRSHDLKVMHVSSNGWVLFELGSWRVNYCLYDRQNSPQYLQGPHPPPHPDISCCARVRHINNKRTLALVVAMSCRAACTKLSNLKIKYVIYYERKALDTYAWCKIPNCFRFHDEGCHITEYGASPSCYDFAKIVAF